jgi:hypothetical protein
MSYIFRDAKCPLSEYERFICVDECNCLNNQALHDFAQAAALFIEVKTGDPDYG